MDREKVIRSLETAVKNFERYSGDEYGREYDYARVEVETLEDALALLKAQEPVMVEERADTNTINCPKCGQQFARVGRDESIYLDTDEEPNYCPKCGQAVKWE